MNPLPRSRPLLRALRLVGLLVAGLLAAPLALALGGTTAFATEAVAHGQGVLWAKDHTSWLGNYLLDDGRHGYCIDVEKPPPIGAAVDYLPGTSAAWFGTDDSARLAFISREWGAPGDPLTAAAAQLATWTVTGLAGHDQAFFAQRANGDADLVVTAANHMLRVADGAGGASRGVSASVTLDLDGPGGRVVSDLVIDHLAGARSPAPGSFTGSATLRGATFPDGRRTAAIPNGVPLSIVPDQRGATEQVTVDVVFEGLPFGADYRLGRSTGDTQSLLVTEPYDARAEASATASAPSELPFAPRVITATSEAVASPGTELTDILTVSAHPQSPTGTEWGVHRARDGSLQPIPVVVESVLWGPFGTLPEPSPRAPADAPRVCTVELRIEGGPGTYRTPPCTITAPGYYVWTDSIDPARTPRSEGGDRLQPWSSEFGVATETTLVPAAPEVSTVASQHRLDAPGCVSDALSVRGLPEGAGPVTVDSTLIGPLAARPPAGQTPPDWRSSPVAGEVTTMIIADGTHESPCIPVAVPGFYYFVFDSAGSAARSPSLRESTLSEAFTEPLVPPFADTRVHESESLEFRPPPSSPPPASPPVTPPAAAPPATVPPATSPPALPPALPPEGPPTTARAQLPRTGAAPPSALTTAVTIVAIMAGLAGLGVALRRRS
ncbi:LPXTG cell wall anchor domain-containing protein [Herbiconiux sp.]|uniref:LPXTG cell wall anchor domain-containing protein n=1 Tax=Herbiconiux sp. TaxID=1871186 RepID=UPI0025C1CA67|nr:LPXTG cell wall anchor domain-containing protein [Herbiconiux sp.]